MFPSFYIIDIDIRYEACAVYDRWYMYYHQYCNVFYAHIRQIIELLVLEIWYGGDIITK